MTMQRIMNALVLAILTSALLPLGCTSQRDRLVNENYAQIRTGVHTKEDVATMFGKPDCSVDRKIWFYELTDGVVFVTFDDKGRVTETERLARLPGRITAVVAP